MACQEIIFDNLTPAPTMQESIMAFPKPHYLDIEQIELIINSFPPSQDIEFVRLRYKNKQVIKKTERLTIDAFRKFVVNSIEDGFGADIELYIPAIDKTLIGHHDGVYWFEENT
jgi:hypothetical protein